MDAVSGLLPFVLILVAFYFLIVRPARNRQRAALELQERLAPGVEVMTTSGIFGTVVGVDDTSVQLEVAPGTTLRGAKPAVGQVLTSDVGDDATGPDDVPGEGTDTDPTDPRDDHSTR